ncbi:MAG: hypothetical protein IPI42_06570 [Saprospiraceae bacterium]|nr:hypothetical protein [Candidatus Parvibacillus calidus]
MLHWQESFAQKGVLAGCNFCEARGTAKPIDGQKFWKPGDDFMGDPPMEEQSSIRYLTASINLEGNRKYISAGNNNLMKIKNFEFRAKIPCIDDYESKLLAKGQCL